MAKSTEYTLGIRIAGKVDPSLKKSSNTAIGLLGKIRNAVPAVTTTALVAGVSAVKQAVEFESTMADVAKVVDGLRAPTGELTDEYYALSNELLELSRRIPMTAAELGEIMAAAGQSGVAADELVSFTEAAAKMGIAFDTTAEQAGSWMASWRTAMGLTQEEVVALADQINYLGNTTSEDTLKLSEVVSRVGALGKASGLAGGELAALGASMPGVEAEIAATGIKNLMLRMTAGAAATSKQQQILQKLGFSATELADRMQTDAKGAIVDLLAAINRLPEAERSAALSGYFGSESVSALAPLLTNLGYLEKQFDKVADAAQYAGSMESEYAARADTHANSMQLLANRAQAAAISFGNLLMPALDVVLGVAERGIAMAESGAAALAALSGFVRENQMVLEMAAVAVMTFAGAMNYAKLVDLATTAGVWAYCVATDAAALATKGFGAALTFMTSPAAAVAAGIAAVAAAGVYLYHNWDELSAKGKALFNSIISGINGVTAGLNGIKITVPDWVPKIGGKSWGFNIPEIPALAKGGVVTAPTLSLIGEGAEPEAVLPLSKLSDLLRPVVSGGSISYAPNITINGTASRAEVESALSDSLRRFKLLMKEYQREAGRKALA